jgi:hypothetical protein
MITIIIYIYCIRMLFLKDGIYVDPYIIVESIVDFLDIRD